MLQNERLVAKFRFGIAENELSEVAILMLNLGRFEDVVTRWRAGGERPPARDTPAAGAGATPGAAPAVFRAAAQVRAASVGRMRRAKAAELPNF